MIEYKIEEIVPSLKSAIIYPEEYIRDLFLDISIHNSGTKDQSASITIMVPEEFIKQIHKKTGIKIIDLVAKGEAPKYKKYLIMNLDQNIRLLYTEHEQSEKEND